MTAAAPKFSDWLRQQMERLAAADGRSGATPVTGGDLDQEPVVVWQAANMLEAVIVKGRLESENIPAIVRGETLGAIYGLTTGGLASTDVLVPAALAKQAIELLNTAVEWDDEDSLDDAQAPD